MPGDVEDVEKNVLWQDIHVMITQTLANHNGTDAIVANEVARDPNLTDFL